MSELGKTTGEDVENDVFLILSHPIRRKILQEIFEEGSISFTKMSKEWGLSTGVIYHHLKLLGPLIKQENKKYVLTDKGYEVCEWFLKTKAGRVTVEKVSFFSEASNRLLYFIAEHKITVIIVLLVGWLFSSWVLASTGAIVLGPLFYGQQIIKSPVITFLISVLSFLGGVILQWIFLSINRKKMSLRGFAGFLFSMTLTIISILILFGLNLLGTHSVRALWLITMIISQAWFVATNTLVISNYYSLSIEKSALFSIIILYFYVFTSFIFITG